MNKTIVLVRIDSKYCDYLRQYDNRVPYNYAGKVKRPYVGVLFEVNSNKYFAPLSSPKPKHLKLKNKIDFLKIDNGNLGAVNFNNMVPVKDDNIIHLNLEDEDRKDTKLLKEQIFWLNRNREKLYNKSKQLYDRYKKGILSTNIINRCCNFPLLEEKCNEYNS